MTADNSNQAQADYWTAAGRFWTAQRDRFDAQLEPHGQAALEALQLRPGQTVIDVGCGNGTTTLQIAELVGAGGLAVGLDISPTMIEGATERAEALGRTNVTFEVKDVSVGAFSGDADAVYSRFGVMFFADPRAGFANVRTLLRPGGRLGFACWQSPELNPWLSVPQAVARRHVEIPFSADPTAPGPFAFADPDRVRTILEMSGFTEPHVRPNPAPVLMGTSMTDAVDFFCTMMPAVAALESDDPARHRAVKSELADELSEWLVDGVVQAPSASWIVTARRPE